MVKIDFYYSLTTQYLWHSKALNPFTLDQQTKIHLTRVQQKQEKIFLIPFTNTIVDPTKEKHRNDYSQELLNIW